MGDPSERLYLILRSQEVYSDQEWQKIYYLSELPLEPVPIGHIFPLNRNYTICTINKKDATAEIRSGCRIRLKLAGKKYYLSRMEKKVKIITSTQVLLTDILSSIRLLTGLEPKISNDRILECQEYWQVCQLLQTYFTLYRNKQFYLVTFEPLEVEKRVARRLQIYHDGENCFIPNNSGIAASRIYDELLKMTTQVCPEVDLQSLVVDYRYYTKIRANIYSPSKTTLEQMRDLNITHIDVGNKESAVDNKIKSDVLSFVLQMQQYPQMAEETIVLFISSDRDFSSEITSLLRNKINHLILLFNQSARESYVNQFTLYKERLTAQRRWQEIIDAAEIKVDLPRTNSPTQNRLALTESVVVASTTFKEREALYLHRFVLTELNLKYRNQGLTLALRGNTVEILKNGGGSDFSFVDRVKLDLQNVVSSLWEEVFISPVDAGIIQNDRTLLAWENEYKLLIQAIDAPPNERETRFFVTQIPLNWSDNDLINYLQKTHQIKVHKVNIKRQASRDDLTYTFATVTLDGKSNFKADIQRLLRIGDSTLIFQPFQDKRNKTQVSLYYSSSQTTRQDYHPETIILKIKDHIDSLDRSNHYDY